MLNRVKSWLRGGLLLLLSGTLPVHAGSIQVSPVRAELSVAKPITALSVRNTGNEPITMQLEVVTWSQQDGKDVYVPTREVLATPPIFTVPAGKSQVLRLGLRRAPDKAHELSYRVFLQEVPPPPKPGFRGLQMAMRFGVPIFVVPASPQASALSWRVYHTADGKLAVTLDNNGAAHVRVSNIKLDTAGGKELTVPQKVDYVLPGQTHRWPVNDLNLPIGASVHISARTESGDIDSGIITVEPQ